MAAVVRRGRLSAALVQLGHRRTTDWIPVEMRKISPPRAKARRKDASAERLTMTQADIFSHTHKILGHVGAIQFYENL